MGQVKGMQYIQFSCVILSFLEITWSPWRSSLKQVFLQYQYWDYVNSVLVFIQIPVNVLGDGLGSCSPPCPPCIQQSYVHRASSVQCKHPQVCRLPWLWSEHWTHWRYILYIQEPMYISSLTVTLLKTSVSGGREIGINCSIQIYPS